MRPSQICIHVPHLKQGLDLHFRHLNIYIYRKKTLFSWERLWNGNYTWETKTFKICYMVKHLSCCHLLSSTFSVKSEQRSCRKTLALHLSQSSRGNKEKDRGVCVPDDWPHSRLVPVILSSTSPELKSPPSSANMVHSFFPSVGLLRSVYQCVLCEFRS